MKRIIGIYKITNKVNGKSYIGQTINYRKRKNNHINYLNNGKHSNMYLQRSWIKYGEKNFSFEFIHECDVHDLDEKECYYIDLYKTLHGEHGYNLLTGGQSYRTFTDDVKKRMGLSRKGMKFTDKHKRKIGLANKGRIITKESIEKANASKKEKGVHLGEKNPNATITNATAKKIILCLLKNEPVKLICDKYDTTSDTVYNIMYNKSFPNVMPEVRDEISKRTLNNKEKKISKAIELYLEGKSQNQISKELKVSRNTLRKEFKEKGIDTQLYKNQFTE